MVLGLARRPWPKAAAELDFPEFERVFFCNFFYLHQTEINLIKGLLDKEKAGLFFQGSQDEWPLLKKAAQEFSGAINPSARKEPFINFLCPPVLTCIPRPPWPGDNKKGVRPLFRIR